MASNRARSAAPLINYMMGTSPTGEATVLVQPVVVAADEPYLVDQSSNYCWRAMSLNGFEINLRLLDSGELYT